MFHKRLNVMILVVAAMMVLFSPGVTRAATAVYADNIAFNADGPINGWYWLRSDEPHWFQWTFYLDPGQLGLSCNNGNPNFHLVMIALVTNGYNGGPGHEKRLDPLEIFIGTSQYFMDDVVLQNPSCERRLEDSNGQGYMTFATFDLPAAACLELLDTGELVVEYVWSGNDDWVDCCCISDHHVAFNTKTGGLGSAEASLKIVID